jgi:hypothetical protein
MKTTGAKPGLPANRRISGRRRLPMRRIGVNIKLFPEIRGMGNNQTFWDRA